MNQDRKRWSDIEMWVDVGEKTIVTTLEASWPKALAILHFPLSKKQHENRPTKQRDFTALLIRSCYSLLTHRDNHTAKRTPTREQPHRCMCRNADRPINDVYRLNLRVPNFFRIPLEDLQKRKTLVYSHASSSVRLLFQKTKTLSAVIVVCPHQQDNRSYGALKGGFTLKVILTFHCVQYQSVSPLYILTIK